MEFQAEILVCGTLYGDLQKIIFSRPLGAILDPRIDLNLALRGLKSLKMVPLAYFRVKCCDFEIRTNLVYLGSFWKALVLKDHVLRKS